MLISLPTVYECRLSSIILILVTQIDHHFYWDKRNRRYKKQSIKEKNILISIDCCRYVHFVCLSAFFVVNIYRRFVHFL